MFLTPSEFEDVRPVVAKILRSLVRTQRRMLSLTRQADGAPRRKWSAPKREWMTILRERRKRRLHLVESLKGRVYERALEPEAYFWVTPQGKGEISARKVSPSGEVETYTMEEAMALFKAPDKKDGATA